MGTSKINKEKLAHYFNIFKFWLLTCSTFHINVSCGTNSKLFSFSLLQQSDEKTQWRIINKKLNIFQNTFIFLNIATLQNNFFLVQLTIVKFYKYIKRFPNSSHSITKWRQGSPLKSLLRGISKSNKFVEHWK